MKNKTFIKQSAYQKVPNTAGANIKGALNLNKEVLDTLVDKDVLSTVDCCQYFPRVPSLLDSQFSEDYVLSLPVGSLFIIVDENGDINNLYIVLQLGGIKGYGAITINI